VFSTAPVTSHLTVNKFREKLRELLEKLHSEEEGESGESEK
jgi:uncharacterized coiled-coil protein SlyX